MSKRMWQMKAFDVGYASDQGGRENQEDNLGFRQYGDGSLLAVLSDGMGGHAGGEVASEMAVRLFGEYFPQTVGDIPVRLDKTLHQTNLQICTQAKARKELQTMGATLIAVFVQGNELHWLSVGDSLLYRHGKASLAKINAEHTLGERFKRLLEAGSISRAEYDAVEEPYALTSALGLGKLHEIDNHAGTFGTGEMLILASDGLLTLGESEISGLVDTRLPAQSVADQLLQGVLAKATVSQDNISIIVIKRLPRKLFSRSLLAALLGISLVLGATGGIGYLFYQEEQKREQAEQQAQKEKAAREQAEQQKQAAKDSASQAETKANDAKKEADAAKEAQAKAKEAEAKAKQEAKVAREREAKAKQEADAAKKQGDKAKQATPEIAKPKDGADKPHSEQGGQNPKAAPPAPTPVPPKPVSQQPTQPTPLPDNSQKPGVLEQFWHKVRSIF